MIIKEIMIDEMPELRKVFVFINAVKSDSYLIVAIFNIYLEFKIHKVNGV